MSNKFRPLILVISLIVIPCTLIFAQKNYIPGYIVTRTGDTIRGLIDYRNWDKNPGMVDFKESENNREMSYSPWLISAFGVNGEKYESAVFDIDLSPFQTAELNYEARLILRRDSAFLRAVVTGLKSLYYYKAVTGREYFYIRQGESFELLQYKRYLKDDVDRTVIVENKTYTGQLALYLNDCASLAAKLNKVAYKMNSLEDLFLTYYTCMNKTTAFHSAVEKTHVAFGVTAGASLTMLRFSSEDFQMLPGTDFSLSTDFSGGFVFDIILPRNSGKWSVSNELIWSSYRSKGTYTWQDNHNTVSQIWLGFSYLKLNNMIRYRLLAGKIAPFLNLGVSNGLAILESNQLEQESDISFNRIENGKALAETRKWEVGFNTGCGIAFNRFTFEARYEMGNGMSTYIALKSVTYRVYFLLGYRF